MQSRIANEGQQEGRRLSLTLNPFKFEQNTQTKRKSFVPKTYPIHSIILFNVKF